MRALVTGATGFIGRRLVDRLISEHHPVRLLGRWRHRHPSSLPEDWRRNDVDLREWELGQPVAADDVMGGIDVVFHLAWQTNRISTAQAPVDSPDALIAANLNGTDALIDASQKAGVSRFIFTSTVSVYGAASMGGMGAVAEDDPLLRAEEATNPYWQSYALPKVMAEQWIQTRLPPPDYVILRPSLVYGPGAPFAPGILRQAASPGSRRQNNHINQWVHVDDLAEALMRSATMDAAANQIFNIAGTDAVSTSELMAAVRFLAFEASAGRQPDSFLPTFFNQDPRIDNRRAKAVLGFESAVPFARGLAEMVAHTVESFRT